VNQWTVAKY